MRAEEDRPSLRERLAAWRVRLVADPRFQRFCASVPGLRGVARAKASALFDIAAGFVYSQVYVACVRLDLFAMVSRRPATAAEIAARCELDPEGAARLLAAAAAIGLLQERGGRYALADLGAAMLGNPGAAAMALHHHLLYADLADPVAMFRKGRGETALSRYWAYARSDDPAALHQADVAGYTALMAASQSLVADDILDAYPFGRHRALIDVAGGDGAFLRRAAARFPRLALTLVDLPPVAAIAAGRMAQAGLPADRVRIHGADARAGGLPGGHDVATLVRILHDHDDDGARAFLAAAHGALEPGGALVVAEPRADAGETRTMGDAYFGVYLYAMGSGRPRSAAAIAALLKDAGFRNIRPLPTKRPLLVGVVAAQK